MNTLNSTETDLAINKALLAKSETEHEATKSEHAITMTKLVETQTSHENTKTDLRYKEGKLELT